MDVSASNGRHRAAPKPSRAPVTAGAITAAAAVAVTGFVVLGDGADESAVVSSAASALGGFHSASLDKANAAEGGVAGSGGTISGARSATGEVQLARAARAKARELLAERIAAVERQAAAAARAKLIARQRACGYNPSIQRGLTSSAAQRQNARTIIKVAERMGLPRRAAVIAIATALQESFLRNINHGHLDSQGLFQQRPSAGWGSPAQVTNPDYAARAFYRKLKEIDGWRHLPVTVAAQRVQISAFPWAYARWERAAASLVRSVTDARPEALTCTPR